MIKIFVFSVISAVVFIVIKKYAPEFSLLAEVFAVTALLIFIMPKLINLLNFSQSFMDTVGVNRDYFGALIKITGIALLTQFASDICKDSSQSALASQVEFAGKILILVCAVPIFKALMQTVSQFFNNGS